MRKQIQRALRNPVQIIARVLPLELLPVPGHGAQITARAPTKGCVQTGARVRASSLNRALAYPEGRGFESRFSFKAEISF